MQKRKSTAQGPAHSKADPDGAEHEREVLAKLRTRLRLLEKDREVHRRQTRWEIQKQEQEMERLMSEQARLQWELGMKNSSFQQNRDQEDMDKLRDLIDHIKAVDEELEREAQKQLQIRNEISDMELELSDLRKGEANPRDRQAQRRRNMRAQRILEDKLQRALSRFSEQICRNRELREELQTMLGGRAMFQRLIKGRRKELQEVRQQIKGVTEQCLATCEASVEARVKIAAMREECVKEREKYSVDMQRLQLINMHGLDLSQFLRSKRGDRESILEKDHREEETLDSLKEEFDRIRIVTREDDLDKLLNGFSQAEDQNFTLFNFVKEQNKEIEALRDEIEQIQDDIEKYKVRCQQTKQSHRAKMEKITKQRQEVEARTALYENQANVKRKTLEQIKTRENSICSKIGCDSDGNFSSFLGAVEQRTKEMLTIKAWIDKQQQ